MSIDVSKALELDGVYGTLTGDEVAILTDPFFELSTPPGRGHQGLRARGRQGAAHRRAGRGRRRGRRASSRATPPSSSRSSTSRSRRWSTPSARSRTTRRSCTRRPARTSSGQGLFDWGDYDAALAEADQVVRIERLHFDRFSSTPLECAGCARRVRPRHRAVDDLLQPPDARRSARSGWGPRCAVGTRQAPLRHPRHRRRLRQQDLPAPAVHRLLPARAEAQPARPVDGVAHRPAHGERARERAHVPRRRGAGARRTGRCSASR